MSFYSARSRVRGQILPESQEQGTSLRAFRLRNSFWETQQVPEAEPPRGISAESPPVTLDFLLGEISVHRGECGHPRR